MTFTVGDRLILDLNGFDGVWVVKEIIDNSWMQSEAELVICNEDKKREATLEVNAHNVWYIRHSDGTEELKQIIAKL